MCGLGAPRTLNYRRVAHVSDDVNDVGEGGELLRSREARRYVANACQVLRGGC